MTTKEELSKKTDAELEAIMAQQQKILSDATKAAEALLAKKNKSATEVKTVDTSTQSKELSEKEQEENKESTKDNKDENLRSEYYDKALEIITKTNDTTFSNLQRKLKISTNKAKRLLEIFEQDGILGPSIKGAPREILKKELSEEEKEILAIETEYNLKIKDKKDKLDELLKENDKELEKSKKEVEEKISDEEYKEYVDNNVSDEILNRIAEKGRSGEKLSLREQAILTSKTPEIQEIQRNFSKQNNTEAEKEESVKNIKEKLMGLFRRKEKQKVEVYTEEEEKAWILFIKTEIEKGTSQQEIQELNLRRNEEKRRLEVEKGPLSPRIKSGISKGIENWDNWGSEGGKSGFAKKTGKMILSLGLIIGTSTFSVEKMASLGIGTASALGASVAGKKLLMGLGFGTAMSLLGTMSPEKAKKVGNVFRILMPAISIGIAVATGGGALAAAAIGGSAAFGYMSSKLVQKRFSEEKIQAKLDTIKNRTINLDTLEADLSAIENDTREILKQAENIRLYRKALGGVAALAGSVAVLEASGYVHDLHTEHQGSEQQKIDDFNNKHETNVKHIADMNEKHLQHEAEMKHHAEQVEQQIKNDSETQNNQPESNDQTQQDGNVQEFMKSSATQDAIKLGMYNPENPNESMIVQSGTVSFDSNGHHVEVPYSSHGAIQTIIDLKKAMAIEFGGEEKIPNGNMTTHYVDMKGLEHDQSLIHSENNGVETVEKFKGDMFDSDHSKITAEHSTHDGLSGDNKIPEQVNPETGLPMNHTDSIGDHTNTQGVNDYKVPSQVDPVTGQHINAVDNHHTNTNGSENGTHTVNQLSPENLEHVSKIYTHNINHLFTERPLSDWEHIKNDISAPKMFELSETHQIGDDLQRLFNHLENLKKIAGSPYNEGFDINGVYHDYPETIPHYIGRALEEAERTGQIDKVTL